MKWQKYAPFFFIEYEPITLSPALRGNFDKVRKALRTTPGTAAGILIDIKQHLEMAGNVPSTKPQSGGRGLSWEGEREKKK